MQEEKRSSLIRVAIPIFVLVAVTATMYMCCYRPMIQDILASIEKLKEGAQELERLKKNTKEIKALTDEERVAWKMVQEEIYRKLPPPERLPKRITFKGSPNLFYGTGDPLLGRVPQLFLDVIQPIFDSGQKQVSLSASYKKNALEIPAPEGIDPLKLDKSTLSFTLRMSLPQLADFLARLRELPRFIKVTKIAMRPGKGRLKSTVTLETYHCREGVLGDVSKQ